MANLHRPSDLALQPCRICDEGMATLVRRVRELSYGREGSLVTTKVVVPIWECDSCGMSYLAEGAEDLQHEAICKALGRLTPREILDIRDAAELTQKEFAAELEVGIASLKRWELGLAIQDKNNDRLIRGFTASTVEAARPPTFRTQLNSRAIERASRFLLRPDCRAPVALAA